jgi:hypothetical protein
MPRTLDITGEYPPDWKEISNAVWAAACHRCIRCGHPYRKGAHGKGQWTPCDERCTHGGPVQVIMDQLCAEWRIGTVHHLDGNKANCAWWNLLALCQRCRLTIQSRVNPQQPYMLEHSEWFRPYVAGFYAHKYEGVTITREQAVADMPRLLAYERIA